MLEKIKQPSLRGNAEAICLFLVLNIMRLLHSVRNDVTIKKHSPISKHS